MNEKFVSYNLFAICNVSAKLCHKKTKPPNPRVQNRKQKQELMANGKQMHSEKSRNKKGENMHIVEESNNA